MVLGALEWTSIIVAFVAGIPATLSAVLVYIVRRDIATPSGDSLGQVVERTHDTGIATHLIVRKMNNGQEEVDAA